MAMTAHRTHGSRRLARALARGIALSLATMPAALAAQLPAQLDGFDDYVRQAMTDWHVPGLSVAIVKHDSIVFARGYGTRTLGQDEPVDEHTVFAIGSATKAFTTVALGILVDEGRLELDDRVIEHLPDFRMYDPWVTREITVRDLVTHRSGLPGGRSNLLWYASGYDRDEIVRRIRYLEPTASFRAEYQYQNLMFLTAGQVVATVAETTWDEFVRTRILEPLGMRRSVTSVLPLSSMENVATPHASIRGEWQPLRYRNVDNVGPAGSINSSALDMAQWVRLHLGEGSVGGRRILSESMTREMRTPQFIVDPRRSGSMNALRRAGAGIHFFTYGLGWQVFDYRGRVVVWHGGNIDGMAAVVAMMPEEELGVVVLTNRNGGTVRDALMMRVFDAYTGGIDRDWSRLLLGREVLAPEPTPEPPSDSVAFALTSGRPPSHPPSAYAGTYEDSLIGTAVLSLNGDSLGIALETGLVGTLTHRDHDVFDVVFDDVGLWATFGALQGAEVVFEADETGAIRSFRIRGLGRFQRISR
jgi:CubicO group peptidase (beta-lactamase class C family)